MEIIYATFGELITWSKIKIFEKCSRTPKDRAMEYLLVNSADDVNIEVRYYHIPETKVFCILWFKLLEKSLEHNTNTVPRRVKRDSVTPIQGPILKNNIKFHYKIDSFNIIPQILAEKIIDYLTINIKYARKEWR